MLNSDPPDHTRLRQLVHTAFSPRRMSALRPAIERLADELLDRVSGEVDLVAEYALRVPITVVGELLGLPAADAPAYRRWATGILSLGEVGASGTAAAEMTAYLRSRLADKRKARTDDLLGELARAADAGQLSDDEVVGMAFLLLIGGHETTVNLLSTAVLALLRSPGQRAQLHADPAAAVHELLRYEPPVGTATLRFTTEPVELGGVELPAGSFLLVSLAAANRDPERFTDPDRLDGARGDRGHLAFGHGIHRCLGASLGLLEVEIALCRLFDRFPRLRLAVDESSLRWRNTTMLRGLETLPVHLDRP
jgi:cytochrome P450